MKIIKCLNGHGYDSEKYNNCPVCEKLSNSGKKTKIIKIKTLKKTELQPEIKPEPKISEHKKETKVLTLNVPDYKKELERELLKKQEIKTSETKKIKQETDKSIASELKTEKKNPPIEKSVKIAGLYNDMDIEHNENIKVDDINNMATGKNGTLLIKYIGTNEVVHIPDTITAIGKYAFRGNTTAKIVIMSDNIKTIGKFAFAYCKNLEKIVFSNSLESISENAFMKCIRLKELNFPNSLKTIGKGSFGQCISIKKLTFPAQLKKISDFAFFSCRSLNRLTVPNPVEIIGSSAFSECYGLQKIAMSESVTTIGENAFAWCRSLEEINLPSSVKLINNWAFYGCSNLKNIKISIQTKDIRDDAFCGCENIWNIKICEFEEDNYNETIMKKGQRLTLKILKQVNRKTAERYAKEHKISMMFI